MFLIDIVDVPLQGRFSDLEKRQLPFATMLALNDAMFAVVRSWKHAMPEEFDNPVQRTINAVSYIKATKDNLVATVYIKGRQDVPSGAPPARYLNAHVVGGPREEKPFEKLLRDAGILSATEFVVPARGFPLDPHGNVPGGVVNAILSDLQASREAKNYSTRQSRAKRARRKDVRKRAVYFESAPKLSASQGRSQHLPRAIYQRTRFGFGSAIRMAFIIVEGPPTYRVRFDAKRLAQEAFNDEFKVAFPRRLLQGVQTSKFK